MWRREAGQQGAWRQAVHSSNVRGEARTLCLAPWEGSAQNQAGYEAPGEAHRGDLCALHEKAEAREPWEMLHRQAGLSAGL